MNSVTLPREYWFGLQWADSEQATRWVQARQAAQSQWTCFGGADRQAVGWVQSRELRSKRASSVLRLAQAGPVHSGWRRAQAYSAAACLAAHHPKETVFLLWTVAPGRLWFLVLEQGVVVEGSDCVLSHVGQVQALRQAMQERYPTIRELRQPDDLWVCLEQGRRPYACILRQPVRRTGRVQKLFVWLLLLCVLSLIGLGGFFWVGSNELGMGEGLGGRFGFGAKLSRSPKPSPTPSLNPNPNPDPNSTPNPSQRVSSNSASASASALALAPNSDLEPSPDSGHGEDSDSDLATSSAAGSHAALDLLPGSGSDSGSYSNPKPDRSQILGVGPDTEPRSGLEPDFSAAPGELLPDARAASNVLTQDVGIRKTGWQLRHIDRRPQFDDWECQNLWVCLRREKEMRVGKARSSGAKPALATGIRHEEGLKLKAIYGRDTRLLAEVQLGQHVLVFQQGQLWPVGRERNQQIRLLSLDSRCIELEFDREEGQTLVQTQTQTQTQSRAQARTQAHGTSQTLSQNHPQRQSDGQASPQRQSTRLCLSPMRASVLPSP